MEGSHPFYPNRKAGPDAVRQADRRAPALGGPLADRRHRLLRQEAIPSCAAPTSTATTRPARSGRCSHDGTKVIWHKELADTRLQITGFGTDSHGEILICRPPRQDKGGLYTLEPTPKDAAAVARSRAS